MLFDLQSERQESQSERRYEALETELARAHAPTPELLAQVRAQACPRLAARRNAARSRLDRLVEAGAWTEAALALVEFELPQWQPRRLVCEDGEWHCCLSKQPFVPIDLDEAAEGTHEVLAIAILIAFLEARRVSAASPGSATMMRISPAEGQTVDCDNYR
jgi:hypothetical protein